MATLVTCMLPASLQAQPVIRTPRRQQRSALYRCVRSQASADEGGVTRREGLAAGLGMAAASAYAAIPSSANAIPAASKAPATAPFELPPLPYATDALEPIMSKLTLEFHWGKHHAAYVANLNNQIKGNQELERLPLQEVMLKAWNGGNPAPAFNNAAQVVNHTFFWKSMKPNGGGQPSGQLLAAINRDFGSFDAFKQQFKAAGATQFGSGWAWLVLGKDGKLKVTKTANAENPWLFGETPILTVDVWEHAYYLDVQNRRPDFLASFVDSLIDWDRVAARYSAARKA